MSARAKIWFYGITVAAAVYLHVFLLAFERVNAATGF